MVWLEKWQKRYNVSMAVLLREAGDVGLSVVSDWSGHLKSVCIGYALRDIFNALPARSLSVKKGAKVGKKSKDRITILLAFWLCHWRDTDSI